jgi:adenylate cyclase
MIDDGQPTAHTGRRIGAIMSDPSSVSRRLVAVFAADVEGYSRLMGADEVGTLKGLTERRAILDRIIGEHRGRIANTAGDSVLAEFGSAVDAVQCAVEAQAALAEANKGLPLDKRISFRIGIHIGDVMVRAGDLFGDGVNIAARLQTLAKAGGVCISGTTYDQVRKVLPMTFVDLGVQQVKNIQEPIRTYQAGVPSETREAAAPARVSVTESGPPLPDKPSIAVLPFQNMSGDPEQEYFADGMVEDITTALSRARWLFVIARNSSFTYKGRAVDAKQVGRELGVRYVLEGSVRKAGARLRITGQLIEALTSTHLWADRFDGSLEDVFELQDQVALSVAGVIEPALQEAEIRRATTRPTSDLTAYDLYLRAWPLLRGWGKEPALQGLDLLREAIARDPNYGPALVAAAWCKSQLITGGWSEDSEIDRREALDLVRRAVKAAPDDPEVLVRAAGTLDLLGEDIGRSLAMLDHALTLNPSNAFGWFWSGFLRLFAGSTETAIEHFEKSLRLDPRTPRRHFHDTGLGACYFLQRRFDEAAALLAGSLRQVPTYVTTAYFLASCYAHMERLDDAGGILDHLRSIGSPPMPPPELGLRDPTQREFWLSSKTAV